MESRETPSYCSGLETEGSIGKPETRSGLSKTTWFPTALATHFGKRLSFQTATRDLRYLSDTCCSQCAATLYTKRASPVVSKIITVARYFPEKC